MHFCAGFVGSTIKDCETWVNSRAGAKEKMFLSLKAINLFCIEAGNFIRFDRSVNNEP